MPCVSCFVCETGDSPASRMTRESCMCLAAKSATSFLSFRRTSHTDSCRLCLHSHLPHRGADAATARLRSRSRGSAAALTATFVSSPTSVDAKEVREASRRSPVHRLLLLLLSSTDSQSESIGETFFPLLSSLRLKNRFSCNRFNRSEELVFLGGSPHTSIRIQRIHANHRMNCESLSHPLFMSQK